MKTKHDDLVCEEAAVLERLRAENERLTVDSVVLDKIMTVIDGFRARNADRFIDLYKDLKDIQNILDGVDD